MEKRAARYAVMETNEKTVHLVRINTQQA
jgi:hypothetical protein